LYIKEKVLPYLNILIISSFYIFSLGVFTSKFLLYLGMGLSLIFWVLKLVIKNKNYVFVASNLYFPMLLFSISIVISGIDNWSNEILSSKFYFSFIFFFIVINELKEKKHLENILKLLLLSSSLSAVFAMYQRIFLKTNRVTGFTSSLAYGNFMAVLVLFLSIYIIWSNFNKKKKFVFVLLDILFFIGLILSKTRGAWLGFIFAILVLGYTKGKKIILTSLVILLVVFMLLPTQFANRFMSSFNLEYNLHTNRSNSVRIGLWNSAFNMFLDNPVNGVGYENFKDSYIRKYKIEGIPAFSHSHNNILNFAAELGIFGLLSFSYLMILILKNLIFYYINCKNINVKLFYLGSILLFVVYNIQGLTQYNFGDTEPLHLFFFVIALNFVIKNRFEFE